MIVIYAPQVLEQSAKYKYKMGQDLHLKIILTNPKDSVFRIPFVIVIYAPQVLEQSAKHEYKMGQDLHFKNHIDKS